VGFCTSFLLCGGCIWVIALILLGLLLYILSAQKLRLVLLIGFGTDAYSFVRDSWVQRYLLELAFGLYDLSAFYRRLSFVLLSQKMNILVVWREALLNISGFLLAAEDGYDSKSYWYFKTQVCQVQGSFECIQEASSEDSVIWVCHINNIEGDVFGVGIFRGSEGHWECDGSDQFNSFSTKATEGLRWFSDRVASNRNPTYRRLLRRGFRPGCHHR
jgi:hypothetical protein